jgi:serine/threonine protein kinase
METFSTVTNSESFVKFIAMRTLEALWEMNYNRLMHRDLKPANMMVDMKCKFFLID